VESHVLKGGIPRGKVISHVQMNPRRKKGILVHSWKRLDLGKNNAINHSPVITIFIGGMVTLPSHGWFMTVFNHISYPSSVP
jgi:hypothetical protein